MIYGLHFPEVRRAGPQVQRNIFQLYGLLVPATVNISMIGEERVIYKVESSHPIFSCPSLLEDTLIKEILSHYPSSLKPIPLSPLGLRDTSTPVPLERADSTALLHEALCYMRAAMLYIM